MISSDILKRNITKINCIFTKREHKKFHNKEEKTSFIIEKRREEKKFENKEENTREEV